MVDAPKAPRKVVLALIEHEGSFVLIRRRLTLLKLSWAFPGGVIEGEETEEEAVVRETKEEVGLDVSVVKKLYERKHPNTLVNIVYFHCLLKEPGQELGVGAGQENEIEKIEWVPAQGVLKRFTSDVDPVIREFVLSKAGKNSKER